MVSMIRLLSHSQEQVSMIPQLLDPLKRSNLEIGLKKDWFGGNGTQHLQCMKSEEKYSGTNGDKTKNNGKPFMIATGEQRARGFEADIKGEIFKGLNVVINYAYTDAKTIKDNDPTRIGFSLREMLRMFRIPG